MLEIYLVVAFYGACGGSSSKGIILMVVVVEVMVAPAVAVPGLAVVCPTAWVFVEFAIAVPVEHAFMQLRNPSGSVI